MQKYYNKCTQTYNQPKIPTNNPKGVLSDYTKMSKDQKEVYKKHRMTKKSR